MLPKAHYGYMATGVDDDLLSFLATPGGKVSGRLIAISESCVRDNPSPAGLLRDGARLLDHVPNRLSDLTELGWPSGTIPSTAQRTARLLVLGFELADHSLGLVVEGGEDLVGVLFRVVKSQAADREIDDFMTVPRSRPG